MRNHYDAIVVGAGPAGTGAAKMMAESGFNVAVFERGPFPGSKNMFGGALYSTPAQLLVPAFWESAPLERAVVSEELWFLDNNSAVRMGFTDLNGSKEPYNKLIISRPKFDRWFAGEAEQAGAAFYNSARVDSLVMDNRNSFRGVIIDDGSKVYGDIVIIAEGGVPFILLKHRLVKPIPTHQIFLYVRENIALAPEVIESRFNLEAGEGAIILALGYPGLGRVSKIGLFTCKESISLIVGGYLNQMITNKVNPTELLRKVKNHPLIKRFIAGGKTVSFTAQQIPRGEINAMPKLYGNGFLVAGDAASMTSGRRGMDLAMMTGRLAAETVNLAKAGGDFSAKTLSAYQHKLNNTFFIQDMKETATKTEYFKEHPEADFLMTRTVNRLASEFLSMNLESDTEKYKKMLRIVKDMQPPLKSLQDIYLAIKDWSI